MKSFFNEFKSFIARGNVMDMAVGIIIGGAFTNIVGSLVNDIINPIIGIFGGMNFDKYQLRLMDDVVISYGRFLTALFNFVIMALVVFIMMKSVNKLTAAVKKEEQTKSDNARKCPYCMSEIDINATRCPHCTSILEK